MGNGIEEKDEAFRSVSHTEIYDDYEEFVMQYHRNKLIDKVVLKTELLILKLCFPINVQMLLAMCI